MRILVPNLGSTSLKYQLLEMPAGESLARGKLERVSDYRAAIAGLNLNLNLNLNLTAHAVDAVAFKAVHAGPDYRGTFIVDDDVMAAMEQYLPAAPAHNAIYLTGIHAFREAMPGVRLVAAFETEFHSTMPEYAARYGVPGSWREAGVRRYGFHGASHRYVSERAATMLGRRREDLRIISCHLGGSSSMCAIDRGCSVDTTMGFSPQSGLENATRHGDLDVFAVLYMMQREQWDVAEVTRLLARTGGLAGLSGVASGDVRDIETAAAAGNGDAALALDVFTYEVRKTIGAYAAAMAGVDAIAFTGGIGENSASLRARCVSGLEFLGVRLDGEANERGTGDRVVSSSGSATAVLALSTNEELIVARRAYALLTGGAYA